eukprot:g3911.t1
MSYSDYLHLDRILEQQRPLSSAHDEMLFIIQHQTSELWMKLAIHELEAAREALKADDLSNMFKMLARVSRIFEQLNNAWDVLRTMTPADYTKFRAALGPSSGFQSYQYRLIEYILGNRNPNMLKPHEHVPEVHRRLVAELERPSFYGEVVRLLYRYLEGMGIAGVLKKELFELPNEMIYLDGNSLGPLPRGAVERAVHTMQEEWGGQLIRAWNTADWISLPQRVGDRLTKIIGAELGSVTTGDTLSIKVYQALAAAIEMRPDRKVILSDSGNFPTDIYIADGLLELINRGYTMRLVAPDEIVGSIDDSVAAVMLTHVDYRTGRMHDMAAVTHRAHSAGSVMIWDLAHSAGAVPLSLAECNAEFAVGCTYKYLNGGPGAPAFIYARPDIVPQVKPALSGWMGHEAPFMMETQYRPAMSIERLRVGTPPIVQLSILDKALDVFDGVNMDDIRSASIALSELFIAEVEKSCPELRLVSPRNPAERGSQVSFAFEHGYAAIQALIDQGVVGDFRTPDVMRFGFTPLYIDENDVRSAVDVIETVMNRRLWDDRRWPAAAAISCLFLAWEAYCSISGVSQATLPSPSSVAIQTWENRGELWENLLPTLRATLLGFSVSLVSALLLSVLVDFRPTLRKALFPVFIISQTLPLIAIAPLVVLWFGFGLLPKILLVALVTFFPMLVALSEGYEATEEEIEELLRSMGATRTQRFVLARFPSALPYFFAGLRISITYAVVGAIFAEYAGRKQIMSTRIRRRTMLGLLSAIAAPASPIFARAATRVSVALDWTANTNHIGLFVSREKGFYREAGLEVDILPYTDTSAGTLVASGVADFGILSSIGLFTQRAAGADLVATYAVTQTETGRLVFNGDRDDIRRPKDLDGMTYGGFGSAWEKALIQSMIRHDGGTGDFETITLGTSAYQALASGAVDFTLEVYPWEGVKAELEGVSQRRFRYADFGVPDEHTTLIGSSRTRLTRDPDAAAAFIRATRQGYEFAVTNPDEASDILLAANRTAPIDRALVRASLQVLIDGGYLKAAGVPTGTIGHDKMEAIGTFLYQKGMLKDGRGAPLTLKPDFGSYYTNELLGDPA